MGRLGLFALAAVLVAGAAEARGHSHGVRRARAPHAPKAAGEGRAHRHSGPGEIGTLGPSTFHPVKRYRGFSYLQHEKHPEKDN